MSLAHWLSQVTAHAASRVLLTHLPVKCGLFQSILLNSAAQSDMLFPLLFGLVSYLENHIFISFHLAMSRYQSISHNRRLFDFIFLPNFLSGVCTFHTLACDKRCACPCFLKTVGSEMASWFLQLYTSRHAGLMKPFHFQQVLWLDIVGLMFLQTRREKMTNIFFLSSARESRHKVWDLYSVYSWKIRERKISYSPFFGAYDSWASNLFNIDTSVDLLFVHPLEGCAKFPTVAQKIVLFHFWHYSSFTSLSTRVSPSHRLGFIPRWQKNRENAFHLYVLHDKTNLTVYHVSIGRVSPEEFCFKVNGDS